MAIQHFVQLMLTLIIPIAFISFYPACEFLGIDGRFTIPFDMSFWTPLIGVVMFILANLVFNHGLRNYESSGS